LRHKDVVEFGVESADKLAVKFITTTNTKIAIREAQKEAQLMRLMSNYNIGPRVEDGFFKKQADGKFAYEMELMDGDLQKYFLSVYTQLPTLRDKEIAITSIETKITDIFNRSNRIGVICKDVKPNNFLYKQIGTEREIKIRMSDFDAYFCCASGEDVASGHGVLLTKCEADPDELLRLLKIQFAIYAYDYCGEVEIFKNEVNTGFNHTRLIKEWRTFSGLDLMKEGELDVQKNNPRHLQTDMLSYSPDGKVVDLRGAEISHDVHDLSQMSPVHRDLEWDTIGSKRGTAAMSANDTFLAYGKKHGNEVNAIISKFAKDVYRA
jgi:hypothetical protein